MEQSRGNWGSTLGFLLAAVGSTVSLGNIWGFPYKMGKGGGFTFLAVYLLLAAFVGFVIMLTEFALGRKTGKGVVGAYQDLSRRFKWVGWLALLSAFLVLSFYTVLGGYCMEYMSLNLSCLAFGLENIGASTDLFPAMLDNQFGSLVFTCLFILICFFINRSGVSDGIEKFNKVGIPALLVILLVLAVRSLTLPGAVEGLKFMFLPGYAAKAGFISDSPSFLYVLATAGGQMFFSLSLAMGAMITYGSYLGKHEDLVRNSGIIVAADTLVAVLSGVVVIPAAVANGMANGVSFSQLDLAGPALLFVSLQDMFAAMGPFGPLFGVLFYLLVLIAAVSSAISLIEVISTHFIDRSMESGRYPNRPHLVFCVCIAALLLSIPVAWDGMGSNSLLAPLMDALAFDITYDGSLFVLFTTLSEGVAMPLGALLMSLVVGWEIRPHTLLDEIRCGSSTPIEAFYSFCIRFVVPAGMLLILLGQLGTLFQRNIFL